MRAQPPVHAHEHNPWCRPLPHTLVVVAVDAMSMAFASCYLRASQVIKRVDAEHLLKAARETAAPPTLARAPSGHAALTSAALTSAALTSAAPASTAPASLATANSHNHLVEAVKRAQEAGVSKAEVKAGKAALTGLKKGCRRRSSRRPRACARRSSRRRTRS